ncbi:Na+/H+ antiporter subunit E [Alkalihalobacillus pseudalcaliphilus]|uniref:Na+/H+ antiporter subunit E n=1 Tax=Alkalihalobacillus pseudalcaliphilus TaxID=79884 RepID=UPI00064DB1B4|nr:Na+/H+ antiporter subunit E [Alkalihalobacillus pseudalcaliphilus]KMK76649.1 monovalent cation/H+ antiporter subunit E [Alkalihalobacillus pseudalcaliphilus]
MSFQLLINFALAIAWMLLYNTYDLKTFIIGYIIGFIILVLMRRIFPSRLYIIRIYGVIHLLFVFIRELLLSNLSVMKIIMKPKLDIKPGIFTLHIDYKSDWELTLLSLLISLTPGTVVIDISHDKEQMYIHTMNIDDLENSIEHISNSFQKVILEVSRT